RAMSARRAPCGWTAWRRPTAASRSPTTGRSTAWNSTGRAAHEADRGARSAIQRAQHAVAAAVEHVGVDLGRRHILVAEQLLDRADIAARFQQVGGERVAKGVARRRLGDAGLQSRYPHRAL